MSDQAVNVPAQLVSAVQALVAEYARQHREKASATLCLELQIHSGGVRDKALTTKTRIS